MASHCTRISTNKDSAHGEPPRHPRRRSNRTPKAQVLKTSVAWVQAAREVHKAAGAPPRRPAGSMAQARPGSHRAPVRKRKLADRDRLSRLKGARKDTWGTRRLRRRAHFIRLMGLLRRSKEDNRDTGSELASHRWSVRHVLFLCAISRSGSSVPCLLSSPLCLFCFVSLSGSCPGYHTSLTLSSYISVHSSCTLIVNTLCKIESSCSLRQSIQVLCTKRGWGGKHAICTNPKKQKDCVIQTRTERAKGLIYPYGTFNKQKARQRDTSKHGDSGLNMGNF